MIGVTTEMFLDVDGALCTVNSQLGANMHVDRYDILDGCKEKCQRDRWIDFQQWYAPIYFGCYGLGDVLGVGHQ